MPTKLIVAMDRAFLSHRDGYFETTCFDRRFFDDYLRSFDEVTVLARSEPCERLPLGAARSDGGPVRFRTLPNWRQLKWASMGRLKAAGILRDEIETADAVVARVPGELGWWAARYAHRRRKPYMIEVLSDPTSAYTEAGSGAQFSLFGRIWTRRLRRLAQDAHAASYVNSKTLPARFPVRDGVARDAISSIRLDAADIVARPRDLSAWAAPLKIITVGSLTARKRPCDLLEAAAVLTGRGFNVDLSFVGQGPEKERLIATAERLGLSRKVTLHGHVADRARLNRLLDQSDLFVMASASEGLPRAVLEAMARGLPAIGTDIQGIDEILGPSELFRVGDISGLAGHVERLYQSPSARAELSACGLRMVSQYASEVLTPKRARLYSVLRQASERVVERVSV